MTSSPRPTDVPLGKPDTTAAGSSAPEAALELLSDDNVRTILEAISERPRPPRDLIEVCEASKPTVYRRLNRLEEAGLVEAEIVLRSDGHHRKEFSSNSERVTLDFDGGSLAAEVD